MPLDPRGQQGFKQFFQNQFGLFQPVNQAKKKQILVFDTVRFVKLQEGVVFLIFLCSDLSLCTFEFKLNKVFDFKI